MRSAVEAVVKRRKHKLFDPASVAANGAAGFVGDPFDNSDIFTVFNGSTNVAAAGDLIGRFERKAGSFNWLQSVSGNRPEYARHPLAGITQLFAYSDTFSNAVWVPTAATKSGRTFTVDGTTATHPVHQAHTVIAGRNYTYTIEFESANYQYAGLAFNSMTFFGNASVCYFRLTDSTVFLKPSYYTTATITQVSANRWRIRITGPCISSGTTTGVRVYPAVSTDGGVTATVSFNGTTYPGSYTLYKAHLQFGTEETAYQESGALCDITQDGQPSVWMPRHTGSSLFTGTQALGSNAEGMYAAAGYNWHLLDISRSLADGTITGQCGTTAASQMLRNYISNNTLQTIVRGTNNDSGVTFTDGELHITHIDCNNGVVTRSIDGGARSTLSVGAAAAETQVITSGAHNAAAPAGYLTGRALSFVYGRSLSTAEEAALNVYAKLRLGLPL